MSRTAAPGSPDTRRWAGTLAAAALQDLGLSKAADVAGGFQAWASCGLPVIAPTALDAG